MIDLRRDIKIQDETKITVIELEQYSELLQSITGLLSPGSPLNENYLTEGEISNCRAEAFFCSNVKERVG